MAGSANAEMPAVTDLIVTPSSYQLEPGETFSVRVNIVPEEPISGAQLDLSISGVDHRINSIHEGDMFSKNGIATYFGTYLNNDRATLYCAVLGPYSTSESGTIATIDVEAGDSTGYMLIDLSDVVLSNSLSQPSAFNVVNTTVLIDSQPVLSSPGTLYIDPGNTLQLTLEAFDPDNDYLVFSCTSLPEGATLNPITGVFTWMPTQDQAGEHVFTFEVKDGYLSSKASANIVVSSSNEVPVVDINGPYTGKAGRKIRFDGSGSYDPDGYIVSYEWEFGDGSVSSDPKPVHIYEVPGEYTVTLTVRDDKGSLSSDSSRAVVQETFWNKIKMR